MTTTIRTRPLIAVLLLAVFALAAAACDRSQADTFVDVGGYRLGVHCEGEGSPTVMLDSGQGSNSGAWRLVQGDVAKTTRVCSYDRAGIANSEDRPDRDIDGGDVTEDLHRLLVALGEEKPVVFAGHSIGGIYIRLLEARYPGSAAGFVFVDPTHEDQFARFDAPFQLPTFGNEGGNTIAFGPVVDELHAAHQDFGDRPVISIDSGKIDNPIWLELRRDLAQRSTNSMLVVATNSGHNIQKQQPDVAIRAIELVVASARSGAVMPACEPSFADLEAQCEPVR